MTRRTLLLGAAVTTLALAAATPLAAAPRRPAERRGPEPRRLRMRHLATGDSFSGIYHNGVTHDPGALAELSLVLADTRTGAMRPFDPAAIDVLWEVAQRTGLGGEELPILSGYRTPETNAAVHGAGDSQHLRAGAVDVMVRQAQLAGFGDTALALGRGGVGIYAARGFVHLDSGPVRHWGDTGTAVARRPANPQEDRLSRMAEAWAATRTR